MKNKAKFLNKNEFTNQGMQKWGWTPNVAEEKWSQAVGDTNRVKSKDEEGWLTVSGFRQQSTSSTRSLVHKKSIVKEEEVDVGKGDIAGLLQDRASLSRIDTCAVICLCFAS